MILHYLGQSLHFHKGPLLKNIKIRANNKFTSFAATFDFSLSPIGQATGQESPGSSGHGAKQLTGG